MMNSALKHSLKGQAVANPRQVLESCLLPAQTSTSICISLGVTQEVIQSDACKEPEKWAGQTRGGNRMEGPRDRAWPV